MPTFGTRGEQRDRLKKHHGIGPTEVGPTSNQNTNQTHQPANNIIKKSSCLDEIEKLKQQREERRARMDEVKRTRTQREKDNANMGIKVDVDF